MSVPPASCPNCRAASGGRYCTSCGQDNARSRLEARALLADALANWTGWEAPILRTLRRLVADPGGLADEYVAGRRRSFVPPARFCLLAIALWFLATRALGLDAMDLSGLRFKSTAPGGAESADFVRIRGLLERNFDVFLYASLPVRAVLLRWLFPRSGRNVAEAMVLVFYLAGFGYLAGTLAAPLVALGSRVGVALPQLLALAWTIRAARTFFGAGWVSAAWRVTLAVVVHTVATLALYAALAFAWAAVAG